jgi:transposase
MMASRTFTAEFRRKVVEDHLHGKRPIAALCREYQLSRNVVARWKQQYLAGQQAPAASDDTVRRLREAEERIGELEAALGRKSMEVDFLQRCFKRAGLPFPRLPGA